MGRLFTNPGDKISLGSLAGNSSYTFAAWIKRDSYGAAARIFDGPGWRLEQNFTDRLVLVQDFDGSSNGRWTCGLPTLSTWVHLAVVYDASSTSNDPDIYLDGVLQTETEDLTPAGNAITTAEEVIIGNRTEGDRQARAGLAHVSVWHSLLSGANISSLAGGSSPLDVDNTMEYYLPLYGDQSPEPDLSGNSVDGTVSGTTATADDPTVGSTEGISSLPADLFMDAPGSGTFVSLTEGTGTVTPTAPADLFIDAPGSGIGVITAIETNPADLLFDAPPAAASTPVPDIEGAVFGRSLMP